MGSIQQSVPCLYLLAAFSRFREALDWGRGRAEREWGPICLESACRDFNETTYYERSMGSGLQKVIWCFGGLAEADQLIERKLAANAWEAEYAAANSGSVARPLNLDPGYLTEAKLVLATTKDRDHRIYLGNGIFAEVTLAYRQGEWSKNAWTYPDYMSPEYHQFFSRCRRYLREQKRK